MSPDPPRKLNITIQPPPPSPNFFTLDLLQLLSVPIFERREHLQKKALKINVFLLQSMSHASTLIKSKIQISVIIKVASNPLIRFFNNTPGNEMLIFNMLGFSYMCENTRVNRIHNTDKFLKTNSFTPSLLCTKILSNLYKIRLQSSPLTN